MGETEEKGTRAAETDKSPRKAPRLEPAQSPSLAGSDSMEEMVISDSSSGGCNHFRANEEETELLLTKIESLKDCPAPACEHCELEDPRKEQLIMVCSQCDQCLCAGVATRDDKPRGHVRLHASDKEHWVALWLDQPESGYCFSCDQGIYLKGSSGESEGESSVDDEAMFSEVEPTHASGSDTDEPGYVIRGIPNVGNTCYLNAMVQCLLVLDQLRIRMLGPDAPKGSIGMALKELFVETGARNGAGVRLNPWKLLASIRTLSPKYQGCHMHDTHELLCFLRNCLNEEELNRRPPSMLEDASGAVAPTVVDSIFQGQLSTTLTSKCCRSNSASDASFSELQLTLPSKEHPAKSVASPQRSRRSQQRSPAVKQLFPVIQERNMEKVQGIADGGASRMPGTELESVPMEKEPEPLEIDSTEAEQIRERKYEVSCSELSQGIIEVPIKSVVLLPDSVFNVKVEEMHKTMADSHSPEDTGPPAPVYPVRQKNASVASGSDVEGKDNAGVAYQSKQTELDIEAKENTSTVQVTTEVHIEAKDNICAVHVTTEDKEKALSSDIVYDEKVEDSNSIASIEDCLALFFREEVVERRCENCSKVPEQPSTTGSKVGWHMVANTDESTSVDRDQTEQSDRKVFPNAQSSDLNSLVVECTSSSRQPYDSDAQLQGIHTVDGISEGVGVSGPEKDSAFCSTSNKESDLHGQAEKKIDLLSVQDSRNASTLNLDRRKQIELSSAHQVGGNQTEQKDRSEHADKKVTISKLPPVLTIQLVRFDRDNSNKEVKIKGHVSFEENLDVGRFMDPSSEDKDNASYCLVGVIEHIGDSTKVGHYVSYVRGSRIGSDQELSSGSSSWFCANDDDIRKVALEEVLKREAYILFYERMEGTVSS